MENLPTGFLGGSSSPIPDPAAASAQTEKGTPRKISKSKESQGKTGHLPATSKTKLPKTISEQDSSSSASTAKANVSFVDQLPQLKPGERYLDNEKLLKGRTAKEGSQEQFKAIHRDFYLNQAIHLAMIEKVRDPALKEKLELGVMRGYAKAAKVGKENALALGIQSSPFAHRDDEYHRSSPGNTLVARLHAAYAEAMDLELFAHDFRLVDSPLVMEVLNRHLPNPGLDLQIGSSDKFKGLVDKLLSDAKKGDYPINELLIDCSGLVSAGKEPKEIKDLARELEKVVLEKVSAFAKENPDVDIHELQDKVLNKMHVVAITEFKGQSVLLLPHFLDNPGVIQNDEHKQFISSEKSAEHGPFMADLRGFITGAGFVTSPDQARKAWLAVKDFHEIMDSANLFLAELATSGSGIPEVAKSCTELVTNPVFQTFRDLGKAKDAPPYLQVMPEATMLLLDGLSKINPTDGGIDKVFKDNGINDLLQVSYFRVLNAAREAILRKDDQMAFNNQIELMHNEIQMILSIVEPYQQGDLEKAVLTKLARGKHAMIPKGYKPHIHLKASAMHAMASAIAGVERQKGTNKLNVVVLKDCYYETAGSKEYGMLDRSQAHSLSVLDGDAFNAGGIDKAFAGTKIKKPVDLFVCEFHHNISVSRTDYKPENIADQLKAMAQKGILADPCTIMIDTTINLEKADDVHNFLADPVIKKMVDDGKLNIVLVRSAQKFDMLGVDNYYGGISISINNPAKFREFNTRMDDPQDQLTDINYQGLTHMQIHGGNSIDKYRRGIMENTQKLYSMLPENAVYQDGTHNLMQISRIEDERVVFLDIKFPNLPKAAEAFEKRLKVFALQEGLPFTTRASFGFANTNYTSIGEEKKRLNPGLEDVKKLERYAVFFEAVQKEVEYVMKHNSKAARNLDDSISREKVDSKLAERLEEISILKPKAKD